MAVGGVSRLEGGERTAVPWGSRTCVIVTRRPREEPSERLGLRHSIVPANLFVLLKDIARGVTCRNSHRYLSIERYFWETRHCDPARRFYRVVMADPSSRGSIVGQITNAHIARVHFQIIVLRANRVLPQPKNFIMVDQRRIRHCRKMKQRVRIICYYSYLDVEFNSLLWLGLPTRGTVVKIQQLDRVISHLERKKLARRRKRGNALHVQNTRFFQRNRVCIKVLNCRLR